MEDLGCLMLDGLYFYQMRGILPGSITVTMTTVAKRKWHQQSVQIRVQDQWKIKCLILKASKFK